MTANIETISAEIRDNMARAFFASAWADQCEESGNAGMMSGCDILDIMPVDLDPAAILAARDLETQLLADNRQFTCLAGVLDYLQTVTPDGGDRPRTAEMLGHYLTMQAMGHGVGLYDAFGDAFHDAVRVPYIEFSGAHLDRQYFPEKEN